MDFLFLDGEDPLEFALLLMRLTNEHMPCGADEEDCVLTMTKWVWRKHSYQRLLKTRMNSARLDPRHAAYDESQGLQVFLEMLNRAHEAHEVEIALASLRSHVTGHLSEHCPRYKFRTTKAWIKALRREVEKKFLPALAPPCEEVRMMMAAEFLTDDVLARELEFERQCDAMFDRALDRLTRLKAAKRRLSLQERKSFHEKEPSRLCNQLLAALLEVKDV
ncbi:hypothetical protein IVB56_21415 [Bradyrhizobium sp. CW7]|uniref:hypothetical protein n=1 Tax=Bradyrhizobium sp. CW7 TaxID=2782688 RepID=UPI001FFA5015|nr:hypothetical protein [Bradyrhizobium sp. CW7]MCK1353577.1 hypothetical protein [Bradyrhizobium sp. CW7]